VDHVHGIDHIAERLAHFPTMGVTNNAVKQNLHRTIASHNNQTTAASDSCTA